jgi:AAA domain (dynein-related subfamily)
VSAIDAALATIDQIGAEGEMDADTPAPVSFDLDGVADPIVLPDGKRIYPPLLFGEPIDDVARRPIDTEDPAASRFLRLTGPPGTGKSFVSRAIAYRLWRERGREVEERHGQPFYGLIEMQPGPSSDEYFFRYEFVPAADRGGDVRLIDSAFVEALRHGWLVMLDEVNTARDVALLSINSCLDGRLTILLPATGEVVRAQPGFGVLLAYNPGLVASGATDIPDAWRSRFPAALEVTSNWAALVKLGAPKPPGYGHLRVGPSSKIPNLHGYPRAVAG